VEHTEPDGAKAKMRQKSFMTGHVVAAKGPSLRHALFSDLRCCSSIDLSSPKTKGWRQTNHCSTCSTTRRILLGQDWLNLGAGSLEGRARHGSMLF
jgi:hypothetical protein